MSLFRIVDRDGDMMADADNLDEVTEVVRNDPLGRYHIDVIRTDTLLSGHRARR